MVQERLKQTLWQFPLILLLSGLIAVAVNHFRGNGIPLIGDWSVDARFADVAGDSLVIDLKAAEKLFQQGSALFLDARPQDQYTAGHIRGALSMPFQEMDRYFMEKAERLEGAAMIITYCDGETCDLSHELALFLQEMGFKNVRVLVNGWTVWQAAGLPVDMGE